MERGGRGRGVEVRMWGKGRGGERKGGKGRDEGKGSTVCTITSLCIQFL